MIRLALALALLPGAAWADTLPFMRKTEPTVIAVTPSPSIAPITQVGSQFRITNPLPCDVRVKGSDGTTMITSTTGNLILARSVEVFSLNKGGYVTVMSVASAVSPACSGNVEIEFGTGQ